MSALDRLPDRCTANVYTPGPGGGYTRCSNAARHNGLCRAHAPEMIARDKALAASDDAADARRWRKIRPLMMLAEIDDGDGTLGLFISSDPSDEMVRAVFTIPEGASTEDGDYLDPVEWPTIEEVIDGLPDAPAAS